MRTTTKALTAALVGSGFLFAGAANAAPVTGGITTVEVTVDLGPITPGLIGTASLDDDADGLVVNFPITGGDLDPETLAGTIEHVGSGLSLTANGTTVNLTDFTIDTVASQLTGVVAIDGGASLGRVAIFDFDLTGLTAGEITDTDNPLISLLLTSAAAGALADALAIPALATLAGAEFGLAATAPSLDVGSEVPLPGAALLFATSAAGFVARRRAKA